MSDIERIHRRKARAMSVASYHDVLAMERVPLSERNIPPTPYAMLKAGAAIAPDAPALTFFAQVNRFEKATVWSHRELIQKITQAGNLFRRLGVERGDAVAFILPNLPETHLAIWGGEAAGIAFAISPLLETEQIAGLLKAVEPKLLVTLAPTPGTDLWQKATAAAAGLTNLRAALAVDMGHYVSAAQGLAMRFLAPSEESALPVPVLDFRGELRKERGDALAFEAPAPGAISSYFCTGGTTGSPKIARRTHFSEAFDAWAMTSFNEDRFGPGKTIFCGLPLFHVNGQLVTGLAPWSRGAHVVMGTPQGYRGEGVIANFWTLVEHFRITTFSGVPTVYSALLQTPIAGRNIKSLEAAICGAAPMPVQLFQSFERETGVRILEGYGLTEGACASSSTPLDAPPRIGSIGLRFPYQDMRALILDAGNRYIRDADTDEIGVIAIRGPNVFAGYLDPRARQGDLDRARRGDVAEHGRSRPAGRRGLLLAHRAQEGADHPRRAQYRSEADRGAAAPSSRRRPRRRDRPPGRPRGGGSGRLRSAQERRASRSRRTSRVRAEAHPRARRLAEGDPYCRQAPDDQRRQNLQARSPAS